MTENMKAFMEALNNNEELGKKFVEMTKKSQAEGKDCTAEFIALAKECGITLTAKDFKIDKEALSDEELENVSGGYEYVDINVDYFTREAIKALSGFGDDFADVIEGLEKNLKH